jgi:hypothetical protein
MSNSKKSPPGKPFEAGKTGNPNGRPVIPADVKALAREHTQLCIDTLVKLVEKGNPTIRTRAAGMLLDRGWGKPVQPVNANVSTRRFADLTKLSMEELAEYERAAAKVAELEERASPPELPVTSVNITIEPGGEDPGDIGDGS